MQMYAKMFGRTDGLLVISFCPNPDLVVLRSILWEHAWNLVPCRHCPPRAMELQMDDATMGVSGIHFFRLFFPCLLSVSLLLAKMPHVTTL